MEDRKRSIEDSIEAKQKKAMKNLKEIRLIRKYKLKKKADHFNSVRRQQ
jgi:hypothetical protein